MRLFISLHVNRSKIYKKIDKKRMKIVNFISNLLKITLYSNNILVEWPYYHYLSTQWQRRIYSFMIIK